MDKRNLKKSEQPERKVEKKDRGDLRKVERPVGRVIDFDTRDPKVHPDRSDLKKADLTKKADLDTHDSKLPPDRGDLDVKKPTRKIVEIVDKVIADRGDLKTTDKTRKVLETDTHFTNPHPDKGDTDRKNKSKLNVTKLPDDKAKNVEHRSSKENIKKVLTDTRPVPNENQKIFTLKPKNTSVVPHVPKKNEQQDRIIKKPTINNESSDPKKLVTIINFVRPEKKESVQRKPIIRTISSRNNSKTYKAVTFVDQKKIKPSVLIKIPDEIRNPKNFRSSESITVKSKSVVTVKETPKKKHEKKKKNKTKKFVASPDLSVRALSPPTEVAKWAPSSINRHTKPYYEAWVDTTLAAISKTSKKDKLFLEKQNILQSFQRALTERPETPELLYEKFTDERYTGKIKVKQRK